MEQLTQQEHLLFWSSMITGDTITVIYTTLRGLIVILPSFTFILKLRKLSPEVITQNEMSSCLMTWLLLFYSPQYFPFPQPSPGPSEVNGKNTPWQHRGLPFVRLSAQCPQDYFPQTTTWQTIALKENKSLLYCSEKRSPSRKSSDELCSSPLSKHSYLSSKVGNICLRLPRGWCVPALRPLAADHRQKPRGEEGSCVCAWWSMAFFHSASPSEPVLTSPGLEHYLHHLVFSPFLLFAFIFFFFFMLHPLRSFQLSFKQILESPFLKTNSATSCCARSQPNHWLSLRGLLRHLPALSPLSPGKTSSWWHQMPSPCACLRELISKIPPHFGATTINASTREGETHRKRSSGFFPF